MNKDSNLLDRGVIHSLTGFSVQLLLTGVLVWQAHAANGDSALHVLWAACAGLIVWLHLLFSYLLRERKACATGHPDDIDASMAEAKTTPRGNHRIRLSQAAYHRFVVPILELGTAALLIQSLRLCITGIFPGAVAASGNDLLFVTIHSISTLVLVVFAAYLTALMRINAWQRLKCARNVTYLMVVMITGLLVGACSRHFNIPGVTLAIGWALVVVNSLLCLEIKDKSCSSIWGNRTIRSHSRHPPETQSNGQLYDLPASSTTTRIAIKKMRIPVSMEKSSHDECQKINRTRFSYLTDPCLQFQ